MVNRLADLYTINRLLFKTTLFRDLLGINWILVTYFCDQDKDHLGNKIQETFAAINILLK